jgi:Na+-transporting methylmalonyl-CoA/oxaloacetate decarboxylase gamma subunit
MLKLLGEGAKFSLIAQTMVFLVLFLLALVILAMKFIFYRPNREAASPEEKVPQEPVEPVEAIRVAAVAAALEMHRHTGIAESPPIIGQEGPWAPRQGRAVMSQSKSRRWSHG